MYAYILFNAAMTHLIPLSTPPMLGVQREICFGNSFLGQEALNTELHYPNQPSRYGEMREAIQTFVSSQDPNAQFIRGLVDARYIQDTAGAPDDFAFRCEDGQSITERLAEANDEQVRAFCHWHKEHFSRLDESIMLSLPEMFTEVRARATQLVRTLEMPTNTPDIFWREQGRNAYYAIDSFDGGLIDGAANTGGIYLAHNFDGGFNIGQPTEHYWNVAFHEVAHRVRAAQGSDFSLAKPVEEALIEHCTVVSAPSYNGHPDDMYRAAESGTYVGLRQLFGLLLAQGPTRFNPSDIAYTLVEPQPVAVREALQKMNQSLKNIMPEQQTPLAVFLEQYKAAPVMHRQATVQKWLGHCLERVGPPEPPFY